MYDKSINLHDIKAKYSSYDTAFLEQELKKSLDTNDKKIIVLDDDPTGVQTVHGINVYTDWSKESISEGFDEDNSMFFILTNSRAFTEEQTISVHKEIALNILSVSNKKQKDFILISRGDSTLRGHYPLETQVLKETLEQNSDLKFDGEVIIPFFMEGGRYTIDNVHYVAQEDLLVPAGQTEFSKDKTFGYRSSHLGEWVEEKTAGKYTKDSVVYISLDELRSMDFQGIYNKLVAIEEFDKVVVNAIEYEDVMVFVIALMKALKEGKRFLFRSAAALTKVIGGISSRGLLSRDELVNTTNKNGGIIIIGSHVQKTTAQLMKLKESKDIEFIEFNQHLILDDAATKEELERVISLAEDNISKGRTVAVYTRRERFDINSDDKSDELRLAVKISEALTSIISSLNIRPNFIIAKGGITSSDIGTKGLGVKKAQVMGQVLNGIPVWLTGPESKFPDMPYVIFPGNVGNETALLDVVNIMKPDR